MKLKSLLLGIFSLLTLAFAGCGNDANGLNGGLEVTATAEGSLITATATYTNPTETNLIGQPISFAYQIGSQRFTLGEGTAGNKGEITIAFTPASFVGSQAVTVIATADRLTGFATVTLTGTSLTVTPPPRVDVATSEPGGTSIPFTIPSSTDFASILDPINNDISGHRIQTTTVSVTSTNPYTLVLPAITLTNSAGTAGFPGASGTLTAPTAVGDVETMTITWKVTDLDSGATGNGVTIVTLTKN